MTTSGGAGDVLSDTGERRGVNGPPPTVGAPRDESPERGEGLLRVTGELGAGDDGPDDDALAGLLPVGLGLDLLSLDLVLERFCEQVSQGKTPRRRNRQDHETTADPGGGGKMRGGSFRSHTLKYHLAHDMRSTCPYPRSLTLTL